MRIRVTHDLGDLANDLEGAPARMVARGSRVVLANIEKGNRIARGFARRDAGPHGKNYFKRLSAEMTGPLSGEFGPTGVPKSEFVGAGFRHGKNLDLLRTADLIGPEFADAVHDMTDGLLW